LHVLEIRQPSTLPCYVSGSGSWELSRNDSYAVVNVRIDRNDFQSGHACGPTYEGQLMLYGKMPPYKLHITRGDPDSGDALQFEKTNGDFCCQVLMGLANLYTENDFACDTFDSKGAVS
jgi:hypothetical protein